MIMLFHCQLIGMIANRRSPFEPFIPTVCKKICKESKNIGFSFLSETLASIGCEPDWNKWPAALKAEYIILTLSEIDRKMLSSFFSIKAKSRNKKNQQTEYGHWFQRFF